MSSDIQERLKVLHDEYTSAINVAVAENRTELVAQLAAEFPDAALQLMSEDPHLRRQ